MNVAACLFRIDQLKHGRYATIAMKYPVSFRNLLFRLLCVFTLLLITILEIGPVPISGLGLMFVVLFRPRWFYNLVQTIYHKQCSKTVGNLENYE